MSEWKGGLVWNLQPKSRGNRGGRLRVQEVEGGNVKLLVLHQGREEMLDRSDDMVRMRR